MKDPKMNIDEQSHLSLKGLRFSEKIWQRNVNWRNPHVVVHEILMVEAVQLR